MHKAVSIRLESVGGLGAHAAARALAEAALSKMGLCAAQVSSRGPERKGALVRSYVHLSPPDRPIHGGALMQCADAIVAFHPALLRRPQTFAGLRAAGTFVYNGAARFVPDELAALPRAARALRIDAGGIAAKEKCGLDAVLLGTLCAALPFIDADAVAAASCADEAARRGFARGKDEPETLAEVGEAEGDVPPATKPGAAGTLPQLLSQAGNTIWNDLAPARGGFLPAFNRERCIHCALCDAVCPDFCLVWEKGEEGGRFERELAGVDYRYCKGCLRCVETCPASAMLKKAETAAFAEQRSVPLFPELVE